MQDFNNRENCRGTGENENYLWELLVLFTQFFCKTKITLKNKVH